MLPHVPNYVTAAAWAQQPPPRATFTSQGYGYTGSPQAMNPSEFATMRADVAAVQGDLKRLDERTKTAATSEQLKEVQRSIESRLADALTEIRNLISPIDTRLATLDERTSHLASKAWVAIGALVVASGIIGGCWFLLRPMLERALSMH